MSAKHSPHLLTNVIDKLERVSGPDKDGWHTALCPFHDDQHRPNLRFNTNGFRCMACDEKGSLKTLADKLGIQPTELVTGQSRIIATYDYCDEDGNLLYQVVRYEPKSFKQRLPDGKGGWVWKLGHVRRVLYRLPELLPAPMKSTIYLPEGEKDVEALRSIGLIATCNPGGAGKFTAEIRGPLKDRHIVVIADKDDTGRHRAQQDATLLYGFAADIKILEMPGDEVKDAADWIIAGGTKEGIEKLIAAKPFWKPEDGSAILNDIANFVERFVVLNGSQVTAISLWIAHTYRFESAEATLYLNIHSAEKRSGKTRLLEILEQIVNNPWFTGRVTPAVLARKIDKEKPTLLLDESDAAFKGDKEYSQTLRGILNTGHRRGGKSSICIGQGASIGYKDLVTYCPKAIAGIGKLPDTISDRSIPIRLNRRASNETVERFRRTKIEAEVSLLKRRLSQWMSEITIIGYEPDIPEELDDRAADGWEVLLAIADIAGSNWPDKARHAAIELMTGTSRDDESIGIRLLYDIHLCFHGKERISSSDLVAALNSMEESPWGDLSGRPIDTRRLARLLKPYEIVPHSIRIENRTPKGYLKQDFHDAWNRYLSINVHLTATSATPASGELENEYPDYIQHGENTSDVAHDSQSCFVPNVADVADTSLEKEGNRTQSPGWEVEI